MKLTQKDLKHTGYLLLKFSQNENESHTEIYPLFTEDLITESNSIKELLQKEFQITIQIEGLYEANTEEIFSKLKEFKEKYEFLPRNYMEEFRTGFSNRGNLKQSSNRFIYK